MSSPGEAATRFDEHSALCTGLCPLRSSQLWVLICGVHFEIWHAAPLMRVPCATPARAPMPLQPSHSHNQETGRKPIAVAIDRNSASVSTPTEHWCTRAVPDQSRVVVMLRDMAAEFAF